MLFCAVCCLLVVVCWLLSFGCCPFVVRCFPFGVASCLVSGVHGLLLLVVCCFGVCSSLFVVGCVLLFVRCCRLLCVACCW